jgi:PAS domain S-box-containing protein
MGTRNRVILTSKADRLAERVSDMGWAPRQSLVPTVRCPAVGAIPAKKLTERSAPPRSADVLPEYTALVDRDRKYVQVSDSFCKLLGYQREELIGRKYDDLTAPRTNNVQTVFDLFMKSGYMHGIWILVHRRGTRILVRYEAWLRPDGLTESQMELLGAGA